jgi:hypothetical protein
MPFTCSRCEKEFCVEHRLPENHACPSRGYNPDHQTAVIGKKIGTSQSHLSGGGADSKKARAADRVSTVKSRLEQKGQRRITKRDESSSSMATKTEIGRWIFASFVRKLILLFFLLVIFVTISITYGISLT